MARKRSLGSEYYADQASRKMQENQDFHMMPDGSNEMANMPQQVVMKYWPKPEHASYDLDDTINGVDNQMKDDMREKKKGMYPEKY